MKYTLQRQNVYHVKYYFWHWAAVKCQPGFLFLSVTPHPPMLKLYNSAPAPPPKKKRFTLSTSKNWSGETIHHAEPSTIHAINS